MDPVSIISVLDIAVSGIVGLFNLLSKIKQADPELRQLRSDLEAITKALTTLNEVSSLNAPITATAKEEMKKTGLADAVKLCDESCSAFSKDLDRWMKGSRDVITLRRKWSVGVWRRAQMKSLKEQIWSCKAIVQLAVTSTQLLAQYRIEYNLEADREGVRSQLQDLTVKIEEHNLAVKLVREQALKSINELEADPEDDDDDILQRRSAILEVKRSLKFLETSETCGENLSRQIRSALVIQSIGDVTTSEDSVAYVGLPEGAAIQVNQRIGNVKTDTRSRSYVGIFPSAAMNSVSI